MPNNRALSFIGIRIESVATETELPYDVYIMVNSKPTMFRKQGDTITEARLRALKEKNVKDFLLPEDHYKLYKESMKSVISDTAAPVEQRTRIVKEYGFIQAKDYFTKVRIGSLVPETMEYMESVFSFIESKDHLAKYLTAVSAHDIYTYNHAVDVAVLSMALTSKIYGKQENIISVAGLSGMLHDIGERGIDWRIINKADHLTHVEIEELKRHTSYGIEYLEGEDKIPQEVRNVVQQHHENFDGSGYPSGKKGEEIFHFARIVTIADVFAALTTQRSYQRAIDKKAAIQLMHSMQPGRFDPAFFDSFVELLHEPTEQ